MIEHLNYNSFKEREVFLQWSGSWYRIPFYVLGEIVNDLEERGEKKRSLQLATWVREYREIHKNDIAIPQIKKILEPVMPEMESYRWEHDGEGLDPYEELQAVNKFKESNIEYEKFPKD